MKRHFILVLAIINVVMSIAIVLMGQIASGISKMMALGRFHELCEAGVVDLDKLKNFRGGIYGNDWAQCMYYIIGKGFDACKDIGYVGTAAIVINAIFLFWFWYRCKQEAVGKDN